MIFPQLQISFSCVISFQIDFTLCSGLLFALCMVLFFFGIACIIVYGVVGPDTARVRHCIRNFIPVAYFLGETVHSIMLLWSSLVM